MKVSNNMIYALQGARGWVGFLAMLGFVIAFIVLAAAGFAIYYASTKVAPMSTEQAALFISAGTLIFNALLAIYPASRLWTFAACCGQFAVTRSPNALYQGLIAHRKFWQFWGISTVIAIVLNGVVLLVMATVGILGAATPGG